MPDTRSYTNMQELFAYLNLIFSLFRVTNAMPITHIVSIPNIFLFFVF